MASRRADRSGSFSWLPFTSLHSKEGGRHGNLYCKCQFDVETAGKASPEVEGSASASVEEL